jgi:hypothetical protein
LAAKFGPEIRLSALTDRFSRLPWQEQARSKKGKSACGMYLPDLEQPHRPAAPPGMVKLRSSREVDGWEWWRVKTLARS